MTRSNLSFSVWFPIHPYWLGSIEKKVFFSGPRLKIVYMRCQAMSGDSNPVIFQLENPDFDPCHKFSNLENVIHFFPGGGAILLPKIEKLH
jgi:hypothetical protein